MITVVSENTDPLLLGEAQEASPIVPGVDIGALGLGDHGDGRQIRESVKRYRFGERKKELSRLQDLH